MESHLGLVEIYKNLHLTNLTFRGGSLPEILIYVLVGGIVYLIKVVRTFCHVPFKSYNVYPAEYITHTSMYECHKFDNLPVNSLHPCFITNMY